MSSSPASSTIAAVSLDHLLYFFVFADINTLGFFSSTSIGPPPDSHPSHRQRYRRRCRLKMPPPLPSPFLIQVRDFASDFDFSAFLIGERFFKAATSESEGLKTYSDQACDQVFSPVADLLYAPDIADHLMLHNFSRD
ncbi:hypothetical protein L2E82_05772 [Cichorium intybus]|uniref:Uncharacterized protein n=1 Tax=Cichorium intybus TaxID=13427 RepID=A0ACB9H9H9_CICIN|nr:hypothetical protein L2E82_05772 [Cichorium intybus]